MPALTLMVCPHDTVRNSEAWYRLVQYLTKRTGVDIHFELTLDFADFHAQLPKAQLVYANPTDSLSLLAKGYRALARPAERYDEALLVAAAEANAPSVHDLNGAALATVERMVPTRLALRMLARDGLAPASLLNTDSWLGVVRTVWGGDAPYGILYRDAYEELSPQGKAMVQVIAATNEQVAFHSFCACSDCGGACDAVGAALLAMADDPEGRSVLADLGFTAWLPVPGEALQTMQDVLQ